MSNKNHATGGRTGTFSNITNTFITPILSWQPIYTATEFDLFVKRNYQIPGLTRNELQVGGLLNSVADTASGDLNYVLDAIDNVPISQLPSIMQQIGPEKVESMATMGFAANTAQIRNLSRRISDLRYGGDNLSGFGGVARFGAPTGSKLDGLMLAYNGSNVSSLITAEREAPKTNWGIYLDPIAVFGNQQSQIDRTGFNFAVGGFAAGADVRVNDNVLVGLATGYTHAGATFYGNSGYSQDNSWPISLYAAYLPGDFYAFGSAGYTLNLFDLKRKIEFSYINRSASSSATGNQINAYGEMGYDFKPSPSVTLTPVVTIAYSGLWIDSFTENAADSLNLKVDSQQANSVQTGLGGKAAFPFKCGKTKIVPQVYASWQHEFANNSRGLDARLAQSNSTTINWTTPDPRRDFAVVGANASIFIKKNVSAEVNYNVELKGNSTAHFLNAGLRWQF